MPSSLPLPAPSRRSGKEAKAAVVAAPRKPRIFRTAVMTAAVFFTVVVWYVACYGYWNWLKGRDFAGTGSVSTMEWDDAVFAPLDSYSLSGYPGHQQLDTFARLWHDKGMGSDITWSEIADDYDEHQPTRTDDAAVK